MVRTREFDPAAALARATELFAANGYKNTSMEDVVNATGVSRYGLYGTFGNKRELFEKVLDKYVESMGKEAFVRLFQPDTELKHIRAIFDGRLAAVFDAHEKCGCLVTFAAMEMAPKEAEVEKVLLRLMLGMNRAFATGLQYAQEKGQVRADLDLEKAGHFLTGAFFGLAVMARSGFSRESLDAYVDTTLATVTA